MPALTCGQRLAARPHLAPVRLGGGIGQRGGALACCPQARIQLLAQRCHLILSQAAQRQLQQQGRRRQDRQAEVSL